MIEKIHQKTWDGILYPVETRKDKVVIVMSGSEGVSEPPLIIFVGEKAFDVFGLSEDFFDNRMSCGKC